MTDPERPIEPAGNARELSLATVAFAVCFYAWALLGPLGPDLQDQLGLSDAQLALTISIPVVLGSLMRIPLGVLTDRHGGRRVFTALMAFTPLPADRPRALQRLLGRGARLRLPARLRRRLVRGRGPVRQQVVPGEPPGLRARDLRHRHGRDGARRAHRAADRRRDQPRRARSGSPPALVGVDGAGVLALARDAPGSARGKTGSMLASLSAFRGPGQRPRLGADALLLHGLRRLRGDVPLPAEAARRRPRPDQDRRRRPRRRLRAARGGRPAGRRRGSSDRIGARDGAHRLVRRHGGARARPRRSLRAHGPADDLPA